MPDSTTFVDTLFAIDGQSVSEFVHEPSSIQGFVYNFSVFTREGLPNTQHTLQMTSSNTQATNILFDYLVYT